MTTKELYIISLFVLAIILTTIGMVLSNKDGNEATEGLSGIIEMNVSAYCPCKKCCGKWADGITASGIPIGRGAKLIAAPPEYAFGTQMNIPGYGQAPVLDRGGAIKGNKLDVLFPTHQEALEWGRQQLKVKVYK